eukprot:scaffold449_cov241-Pinguiococcus_pyrenoidosus.AAC.12
MAKGMASVQPMLLMTADSDVGAKHGLELQQCKRNAKFSAVATQKKRKSNAKSNAKSKTFHTLAVSNPSD